MIHVRTIFIFSEICVDSIKRRRLETNIYCIKLTYLIRRLSFIIEFNSAITLSVLEIYFHKIHLQKQCRKVIKDVAIGVEYQLLDQSLPTFMKKL